MKFTKEQLLDSLKAKLTANGKHLSISEKTIKSLCDSHYELLVNEETELDSLVEKILPQYVSLNGNYEKDNADFIKKWKEEHPDTKPTTKGETTGDNGGEGGDDRINKLLSRLEVLEKANKEAQAAKIMSQKRNELLSAFKEKGIKDEKWTEKYIAKISISDETDVEKETEDALDFYNLSHVSTTGTPDNPLSSQGDKQIDAKRWDAVNKELGFVSK